MAQAAGITQLRLRRRGYFLAAAAVALTTPMDWLELGRIEPSTMATRLSWVLLLLLLGGQLPRRDAAFADRAAVVASVVSAAHFGLITLLSGGTDALLFHWLIALPLAMSLVMQPSVRSSIWTGAAGVVAVMAIVVLEGAGTIERLQWLLMSVTAAGLATWGAHAIGQLNGLQLAAAEQRADALQRLAQTEKVIARNERMAMVGQLAAGVAHEINNPLAFVRSNVNSLEAAARNPGEFSHEELQELIEDTRTGLERIRQIVSDVRSFAREEGEDVVPCDVRPLVEDAVRLGRVKLKNLAELEVHLPETLPPGTVNPRHFCQVLLNLLVNAADALEQAKTRKPKVALFARVETGQLVVTVKDNGPGIPEGLRPRLFEPFFTTKPDGRGTGLGLSISRDYLERMGGTLRLVETDGTGACFELRVPAARPSAEVVAVEVESMQLEAAVPAGEGGASAAVTLRR